MIGLCRSLFPGLSVVATLLLATGVIAAPAKFRASETQVGRQQLTLSVQSILQDDPAAIEYKPLLPEQIQFGVNPPPSEKVVYGGSEPCTSDNLKITAAVDSSAGTPTSYAWSVSGPGSSSYTPPGTSNATWVVGEIKPVFGILTFDCTVSLQGGGTLHSSVAIEVGVRTDAVMVLGWINPVGVTLPTQGVSAWLKNLFKPNGDVPNAVQATRVIFELSENNHRPLGKNLVGNDRDYMLYWLFKHAANPDPLTLIPGRNFRNTSNTILDLSKVAAYVGDATKWKLWNSFQIRYRGGTPAFRGFRVIRSSALAGATPNPVPNPPFPPLLFWGQQCWGNAQGQEGPTWKALLNVASPDSAGVRAFNTLTGKGLANGTTPLFWEAIGSRIQFDHGQTGPKLAVQAYPTYYVFYNGTLVRTIPQASTPRGHFYTNPFPFGTVPSHRLYGTTPGGRDGDGVNMMEPSSRIPPILRRVN